MAVPVERAVWPVLELRARGRSLSGTFPYNSLATRSDRGTVRKERFGARAFGYAIDEGREINLLDGHDLAKPLASRKAGTLELTDGDDALRFVATLPEPEDQPTYMVDFVKRYRAGLVDGISPGFRVPPRGVVPDAEELVPEPGNPAVKIRHIRQAVLFELSLVTRAAYPDTELDLRADAQPELDPQPVREGSGRLWRPWW